MGEKKTEVQLHTEVPKKSRMANMELLRCISMMMVVVLHFLSKGGALADLSAAKIPGYGYLAWAIEALAIVAVNVYMLISGYFLVESSFQPKRIIQLLLQVWFYSIGVGLVAAAFGYLPEGGFTIHYLLMLFFPIFMEHYWFMTAYIFMYLFTPLLAAGVKKLSQKQFQMVLALLLVTFCGIKSVVPARLEMDLRGNDCIWYLCVFLVAAYIRLYGIPFFKNKGRGLVVYLLAAACITGATFLLRMLYLKTDNFSSVLSMFYNYNHVLVLAASLGLFYLFYHMQIKPGKFANFVCKISPYTLGVYLWHEHVAIRYEWPQWLYNIFGDVSSIGSMLMLMVISVVFVFTVGIVLDVCRKLLFSALHRLLMHVALYRKVCGFIDGMTIKK